MTPPTATADTGPDTISARLRSATQDDHTMAESQPFVEGLMHGGIGVTDYAAMVASHLQVYRVLEAAVGASRDHPWCAELFEPKLDRVERLAADLAALCATYDVTVPSTGPATDRYLERIGEIADDPVRLIGHHYIRYLGDLSGGQAIAAMVRRHITDVGLSFYDFADVHPIPHFKKRYRATLDGLPLASAEFEALVDEVRLAFRLNADVFADLMAAPTA